MDFPTGPSFDDGSASAAAVVTEYASAAIASGIAFTALLFRVWVRDADGKHFEERAFHLVTNDKALEDGGILDLD